MKRYTEESQIIADIDRCYSKSQNWYSMAEAMDNEADELFKQPRRVEAAKELREQAKAKRTRDFNLVNKKAKYFGGKLSEFRTGIMPTVVSDTSIQA